MKKNKNTAVEWYEKAAEQGNVDAQYSLSVYYNGWLSYDAKKRFYWLEKAANQGHAEAQWNLGQCYEMGFGTDKDFQKAYDWYTESAENGFEKGRSSAKWIENKL